LSTIPASQGFGWRHVIESGAVGENAEPVEACCIAVAGFTEPGHALLAATGLTEPGYRSMVAGTTINHTRIPAHTQGLTSPTDFCILTLRKAA
jgi:hypothetical protein